MKKVMLLASVVAIIVAALALPAMANPNHTSHHPSPVFLFLCPGGILAQSEP